MKPKKIQNSDVYDFNHVKISMFIVMYVIYIYIIFYRTEIKNILILFTAT